MTEQRRGGHSTNDIALETSHMQPDELVIGIDGGGTKTTVWLARIDVRDEQEILGAGHSGPSNPQAIGFEKACAAFDEAVHQAFVQAEIPRSEAAAACLAVAGADRDDDRRRLTEWANARQLAQRFCVVNDAEPILAAGTPGGWGIALIAGTGSFAFGRSEHGERARAGGWGYLFGDEGSGYDLGRQALVAVARAADGRGPATVLQAAVRRRFGITQDQALIPAIYGAPFDRSRIASLADLVSDGAAAGDQVSIQIMEGAAKSLAEMAAAVADQLQFSATAVPLALAGGVLLNTSLLRPQVENELARRGFNVSPVCEVAAPVWGAVKTAQRVATST